MSPRRRKVLVFGVTLLPLMALFLWLYSMILPSYEKGVLAAANVVLERLSPPLRMEAVSSTRWQTYSAEPATEGQPRYYLNAPSRDMVYISLALLPAFLLATPIALKERMKTVAVGIALLFFLHACAVIGILHTFLAANAAPDSFFLAWVKRNIPILGQLATVGLWALLTWKHWFPKPASDPVERFVGTAKRNDPCPCGSGRKYKRCCGR